MNIIQFIDDDIKLNEKGEPSSLTPHQRDILALMFSRDQRTRLWSEIKKSGQDLSRRLRRHLRGRDPRQLRGRVCGERPGAGAVARLCPRRRPLPQQSRAFGVRAQDDAERDPLLQ
jgi:hypothetical protein